MGSSAAGISRDFEKETFLEGEALNVNGKKGGLGETIPKGFGLSKMMIRVSLALTVGTGAGAITLGELDVIKNITLKTSAGEVICDLPGRALYGIATRKSGSPPAKDAIAAASATYDVDIPIWFMDFSMQNPHDTMIDSSRYERIALSIEMGDVDDLMTAPGTATMTASVTASVWRTRARPADPILPVGYVNYVAENPVDANDTQFITLDRDDDLSIKNYYVHTSANATVGQEFTGTNADDVIDDFEIKDGNDALIETTIWEMAQRENKDDYSYEDVQSGFVVIPFVDGEGSINNALDTSELSKLQLKWTNQAGVGANDQVSVAREGFRRFAA